MRLTATTRATWLHARGREKKIREKKLHQSHHCSFFGFPTLLKSSKLTNKQKVLKMLAGRASQKSEISISLDSLPGGCRERTGQNNSQPTSNMASALRLAKGLRTKNVMSLQKQSIASFSVSRFSQKKSKAQKKADVDTTGGRDLAFEALTKKYMNRKFVFSRSLSFAYVYLRLCIWTSTQYSL